MKPNYKNIVISVLVVVSMLLSGCVESVNENPTEIPQMTIESPVSGSAVHIGKNEIKYTARDYIGGPGLSKFIVIMNGDDKFSNTYEVDEVGKLPVIYLEIPDNFLDEKINYQVVVINKNNEQGTSQSMLQLPVGKNTSEPEAPDSLTINRVTTSEVVLSWADLSNNESRFEIFMSENNNTGYAKYDTVTSNTTSINIGSLSPHVKYYFKVRASHSEYGDSPFSNEVNTSEAGGNEPYHLRAEAMGAKTVHLTWKNMSFIATKIKVQRKHESATVWADIETIQKDAEEYYDTKDLAPGTSYSYRVAAFIQDKWQFSNETSVLTYTIEVPAPSNMTVEFNANTNKIRVSWGSYPQYAVGTKIEKRTGYTSEWIALIPNDGMTTNTYIEDENVTAGEEYFYRARYYTEEEFNTRYSEEVSVKIPENLLPNSPTDLRAEKYEGQDRLLFEWTDNSINEKNFELWGFTGSDGTLLVNNIPSSSGTGNKVYADYAYNSTIPYDYFVVYAVDDQGQKSVESNRVDSKSVVPLFKIISITSSTIFWDANSLPTLIGSSQLLGFYVERIIVGQSWDNKQQLNANILPANQSSYPRPATSQSDPPYLYRVRAKYSNFDIYSDTYQTN